MYGLNTKNLPPWPPWLYCRPSLSFVVLCWMRTSDWRGDISSPANTIVTTKIHNGTAITFIIPMNLLFQQKLQNIQSNRQNSDSSSLSSSEYAWNHTTFIVELNRFLWEILVSSLTRMQQPVRICTEFPLICVTKNGIDGRPQYLQMSAF